MVTVIWFMSKEMNVIDLKGQDSTRTIDKEIDYCPYCHTHIRPQHIKSFFLSDDSYYESFQSIHRCPSNDCRRIFVATYSKEHNIHSSNTDHHLCCIMPYIPEDIEFPENIKNISPSYCRIFKQAKDAEGYGLNDICGMGYRKALEFLIKDYIISKAEKLGITDIDKIKELKLARCISDYIDDTRTKEIAKRAAWLGNDETHYNRRWGDKDLKDLKILLKLVIDYIDDQIVYERVINEMEDIKKIPKP